jgi:hypothetical protein
MDPTDSNDDLEVLAALADGRLSGAERERAIKLLADSDEALELFANTLRDQPTATPVATVVPITSARRWRQWRVMVPAAVAAALAFVAPRLAQLGGSRALANQFATELVRDPRFAGGLREGWEQPVWAVTRGGDLPRETPQAGSPAESRLAFRLGVRTVDLGIALRRGDTPIAVRLADEMIVTLRGIGSSGLVATRYAELKSGLATDPLARSIDRASQNERELRELLPPPFVYGQWARAANLAAQIGDKSFFESDYGTRFIRAEMPEGSLSEEDEKALRSVDEWVNRGLDDRALEEIHNSLQEVIRQHAR